MAERKDLKDPEVLLEQYQRLWAVHQSLMEPLRKRVSKRAFGENARMLMARRTKQLKLDNPSANRVVMDFSIFDFRRVGKTAVDRFLANAPPPDGSDERLVLEAMQSAHYSIFGVDDVHEGLGVQAKDLLQHESVLIADEALGKNKTGGFAIGGRIMRFDQFAMPTGAMLLLTREVMEHVGEPLGAFLKGRGETGPANLSAQEKTDLAILLTRACLVMDEVQLMDADPWKKD